MSLESNLVNVEQAEAWSGEEGEHWVRWADAYDRFSERFGEALFDAAAIAAQRTSSMSAADAARRRWKARFKP